ncbi:MAG: hypothetical protein ACOC7U_03080 [Spirochaetota bacterium]
MEHSPAQGRNTSLSSTSLKRPEQVHPAGLLPSAEAFRYSYDALHEYAGVLFYRLRY